MAVRKSELYRSLWAQCDGLRGSMDASQYKDYVLVLLFMKYVSDRAKAAEAKGKRAVIEIPEGCHYEDLVALAGKSNVGEEVDKKIAAVARENDLEGVINLASFNDDEKLGKDKELVDRVSDLIREFDRPELNFRHNRAEDDDLLGDAYEYLMRHFATESGKSKGQFYTPAEVSRVIARIIGLENVRHSSQSVYDPTCGSGSLLMKAYDHAKQATGVEMSVFGQEMDNATYGLARMNAVLHGNATADIRKGNTLASPQFEDGPETLKRFDWAVANPPFSWKKWTQGLTGDEGKEVNDPYDRFDGYAVPPPKNGDFAFLLHLLASLKSTGTGCIVMPHGVLFRGNKEAAIRRELIRKGYIKGVIGLPANLFYGTGIPACLIVLDKNDADGRDTIFMIDASRGFRKDGAKNRLREQDVHRIVDVFTSQDETDPQYGRCVPLSEIVDNDFNLNIPRYIAAAEGEDRQDIEAHLLGGIPDRDLDALSEYWEVFPSLRATLFEPFGRDGYSRLRVEPEKIRDTIFGHPEFAAFADCMDTVFDVWAAEVRPTLASIDANTSPRGLIGELGESILSAYEDQPLVDAYRVFQHLMDYWAETLKDDVYLIIEAGWNAAPRELTKEKGKSWPEGAIVIKEGRRQRAYLSDLLPREVVIDCFLGEERDALTALEAKRDAATAARDELLEEHGGEDGLLSEVLNDKGNVTKADLSRRLKELEADPDDDELEEWEVLKAFKEANERQSSLGSDIGDRQSLLDQAVVERLRSVEPNVTRDVVIDAKWVESQRDDLRREMELTLRELSNRMTVLSDRYGTPLRRLETDFDAIAGRVKRHIAVMHSNGQHSQTISAGHAD